MLRVFAAEERSDFKYANSERLFQAEFNNCKYLLPVGGAGVCAAAEAKAGAAALPGAPLCYSALPPSA